MVPVRGADVAVDVASVTVTSTEGKQLLKLWLGSVEEALEWAEMVRSAGAAARELPKMLSLTRAQLERLKAQEGESGYSIEEIQALEAGLTQRENELHDLRQEVDGFREAPKMLSLSRRQLAELEEACTAKEERITELVTEPERGIGARNMVAAQKDHIEE